jgi:hypothetical protein
MRGSWRWNVVVATAGSALVAWMNATANPWLTTMERTLFAWIVFYVLAFVLRWMWDFANALRPKSEPTIGQTFDVQTPQETEEDDPQGEFFMPLFEEVRVPKDKNKSQ